MIKTSCFKVSKDKEHTISIARNDFPWSIKGYKFEKYSDLIPSLSLLRAWRAGKITKKDYKKRYYNETLHKLDPQKVYNDLDGKILLCHEPREAFCHRILVARWLESSLGINIDEV
ncbi:MAG: hypothetical protein ACQEQO_12055 [Thermodesulfobacteriota bacterium]